MKKFALMCLLALPVVALSQQQAAAWTKFRLGFSFNVGYEAAGHKLLWYSEQPPPPVYPGHHPPPPPVPFGQNAKQPMPAAADATPPATVQPTVYSASWYYQSYYQPTSYYQAPSYWYGN